MCPKMQLDLIKKKKKMKQGLFPTKEKDTGSNITVAYWE